MDQLRDTPWFLKSNKPMLFPNHEALTASRDEFGTFLANELRGSAVKPSSTDTKDAEPAISSLFIDGLHKHKERQLAEQMGPDTYNKMLTQNADIAYKSSNDKLVDLFYELEDSITGPRLAHVLEEAWKTDPLTSLKIIFNARSIHLGKSSRKTFYRAAGWLAKNHPLTLVANLQWLVQPVIEKKVAKATDGEDDDIVFVESDSEDNDTAKYLVQYGMSHGYWKDLLNMLAIAANGKLDGNSDPSKVLNVEDPLVKYQVMRKREARGGRKIAKVTDNMKRLAVESANSRTQTAPGTKAADIRKKLRQERHARALAAFEKDAVYRTLHLATARLFAEQLQKDISALKGDNAKAKKDISLCAKWAPSDDLFHDKHTFIVSSIAELMYPRDSLDDNTMGDARTLQPTDNREVYLRYAREMYRRDVSQLRKHLQVVERDITAHTYDKIEYSRVPSLAMNNYKTLFAKNDNDRFRGYISDVAMGKLTISGATLLPSTLIKQMRNYGDIRYNEDQMSVDQDVANAQWNALVQRVKDSGSMSSAIAVCDVSGSMFARIATDGTQAIDASIGLSLLVAEVTKPPFGGSMITFDSSPEVFKVDLSQSLAEKYKYIKEAPWGGNTNFVAVFEDVILPTAIQNNLKQEDMVDRIFVFSDMQFDSADRGDNRWKTSYERIKEKFKNAGYEMPELVFWNLAGERGDTSFGLRPESTDASAKPVTAADVGTVLVSGYSQGMLKAFMDGESLEADTEDGDAVVVGGEKKSQLDPLALVKKATSHKAYDMLHVYD